MYSNYDMRFTLKKVTTIFLITVVFSVCIVAQTLAQKAIERHGESYVKTSLNAYSFNELLSKYKENSNDGMSVFELLEFCAENNFDAIDLTAYYFPKYPEIPDDKTVYEIKKYAFQLGLDISGTGVRNDFAQTDPAKRKEDVELVKKWIDVASKFGAPVIRVFAGKFPKSREPERDEVAKYMAECLKECAEYGKQKGVLVGVQNHGDFLYTAEQCIDMLKRVDSDWLGLVVDVGKFNTDDPYKDIEKVMPYAVNFQLKESPYGPGSLVKTDLDRVMQIVNKSGYRGYLPIETLQYKGEPKPGFTGEYDPYELVPVFLNQVKEAMNKEYGD